MLDALHNTSKWFKQLRAGMASEQLMELAGTCIFLCMGITAVSSVYFKTR